MTAADHQALIARFYEAQRGRVTIDGIDLQKARSGESSTCQKSIVRSLPGPPRLRSVVSVLFTASRRRYIETPSQKKNVRAPLTNRAPARTSSRA